VAVWPVIDVEIGPAARLDVDTPEAVRAAGGVTENRGQHLNRCTAVSPEAPGGFTSRVKRGAPRCGSVLSST
jgi:hypothetical protein